MPKVSPTMTMGRLVTWKKQEGDAFEEGEDIADVESDKATMPISAREDGFIARIFVSPDTPDIPLGQVLAITVEEQEFIDAFKNYTPSDAAPSSISSPSRAANSAPDAKPSPNASPSTTPAPVATPAKLYDGPVGPAIMRLLNEFPNLRLSGITPTGPQGRLLKGDVLAAIEDGTAFGRAASTSSSDAVDADTKSETGPSLTTIPSTKTDFTDVPVSSMRRAIAKRLLQSKTTVPHLYASSSYNLNALLALRKRLNAVEPSPRISVNDFVIKAVGVALQRVPAMNVRWSDDAGEAVTNDFVDVSMAVAIEGGLITPIVTGAHARGLADIARVTKELVAKAKEGTLAPEEFEGGSFSVSNLGMFGISQFSAIINPPQSAILAVGGGSKFIFVFLEHFFCFLYEQLFSITISNFFVFVFVFFLLRSGVTSCTGCHVG